MVIYTNNWDKQVIFELHHTIIISIDKIKIRINKVDKFLFYIGFCR